MTEKLKRVCVWCASSMGNNPIYAVQMAELGKLMALSGIRLIYGGGAGGLMRVIADAVLLGGGEVTGVYPAGFLTNEPPHLELTQLITVPSMAVRKQRMIDEAQAIVVAPGGIGTMDEGYEAWTLNALNYIKKPVCLFNINNYFSKFIEWNEHIVEEGFLKTDFFNILHCADTSEDLLNVLVREGGYV